MLRLKKAFILEGDVKPARSWGACLQWTGRKLCQCPSNAQVFCTKMISVFEHGQHALFLLKGRRRQAAFRAHCQWRWRMALKGLIKKHRKNCECCHHHCLFKGHNVNVKSVVPNCQKCYQCLKCQVSGHKYRGLPFEGVLQMSQRSQVSRVTL